MTRRRHDPGAPIVASAYDLCVALNEHVNRFPRAQRTLLGRLMLDEALRMPTALTLANWLADRIPPSSTMRDTSKYRVGPAGP